MEAVHKTREAAEIGRRQIYEKARTWSSSPRISRWCVPHGARVRWSIWKRAEKKRRKPFSRRRGARDWQVLAA